MNRYALTGVLCATIASATLPVSFEPARPAPAVATQPPGVHLILTGRVSDVDEPRYRIARSQEGLRRALDRAIWASASRARRRAGR